MSPWALASLFFWVVYGTLFGVVLGLYFLAESWVERKEKRDAGE